MSQTTLHLTFLYSSIPKMKFYFCYTQNQKSLKPMKTEEKIMITVETRVNAPVEKVWHLWNHPHHIVHWNQASDDWHTSYAENDVEEGGKLLTRMEARDGSAGFDLIGKYENVKIYRLLSYSMDDGRKVTIKFDKEGNSTKITETFDADQTYPVAMQREGWQSILNNFKKYAESGKTDYLSFSIKIDASPEKVYQVLTDNKYYSEWTKSFNPASRYEGSWEKGKEIRFIGEDKEGNEGGMISRIKENIPNRYISVEHLAEFQNGKESGEWAGALENYTLNQDNDGTVLYIDMDSTDQFRSFFLETWPKALNKVKEISEA